ncbi:MAG: hypothetical protein RBU29_10315, partial [bacterium]|nr:hypothetical protein [bacterium]
TELKPSDPYWIAYFPASRPEAMATNLFALQAGKAYLIEMEEAHTWKVKGKPALYRQQWNPNAYNLVGFHSDPETPPTFLQWFTPSAAHMPLDVWTLNTNQRWVAVSGDSPIESGKAYWIRCQGNSTYQGPIEVHLTEGTELRYERDYVEKFLEIQRHGTGSSVISIDVLPSEPIPDPIPQAEVVERLPLAGPVPLKFHGIKTVGNQQELTFLDFPASFPISAGTTAPMPLLLVADRPQMTPFTGSGEALYQSILLIRDGKGFRQWIGVNSRSRFLPKTAPAAQTAVAKMLPRQETETHPFAGLWIGTVTVGQVQEPNLEITTATPAPFRFRIILHVDSEGAVRLLNEVTLLWRDGTYTPNPVPGYPNAKTDGQPGRYILVTPNAPESLLNELRIGETVHPAVLKDGRPYSRRISTAMFSLFDQQQKPMTPLLQATGEFGQHGSELTLSLVMENDDPLNPFHHRFHPLHAYPEKGASPEAGNDWTIARSISLQFSNISPTASALAGWGDTVLGGTYFEMIEGLKKDPVTVEGVFVINQVAAIPVLNDGLTE